VYSTLPTGTGKFCCWLPNYKLKSPVFEAMYRGRGSKWEKKEIERDQIEFCYIKTP
jgi:hypothetical protein